MMFVMLEKIDTYLKENNITFDEYKIDSDLLDDFFRIATTNIIRRIAYKNNEKIFYLDDASYYLKRDYNGELYIEATTRDKKYTVIICSDLEKGVGVSSSDTTAIYSQKVIIQDAAIYKMLQNVRKRIRSEIKHDERYKNITPLEKRKIEIIRMGLSLKQMYDKNKGHMLGLYEESEYRYVNELTIERIKKSFNNYYATAEIYDEEKILTNIKKK